MRPGPISHGVSNLGKLLFDIEEKDVVQKFDLEYQKNCGDNRITSSIMIRNYLKANYLFITCYKTRNH